MRDQTSRRYPPERVDRVAYGLGRPENLTGPNAGEAGVESNRPGTRVAGPFDRPSGPAESSIKVEEASWESYDSTVLAPKCDVVR
jgi:hypothetical protein